MTRRGEIKATAGSLYCATGASSRLLSFALTNQQEGCCGEEQEYGEKKEVD